MTKTTLEKWTIPSRAVVDKKRRQYAKVKHWIGHEPVIGTVDAIYNLWQGLGTYSGSPLVESADRPSTYHEDARFIAPDDSVDVRHGLGYGRVMSLLLDKVKGYPYVETEDYPRYHTGFTVLGKTVTPGTVDSGFELLAKFPVTGRTRQARLAGPILFVVKLLETWGLTQADGTTLLGLEATDQLYVRELFSGHVPLRGRDTKDRIAYLFRIRKTLSALFRDEGVENDWLREPHDLLGGQKPMGLLLEGSMENLLLVKEFVEAAAGR